MIIAVDFDGTIVEHEFPAIGKPVPGAIDWLLQIQEISGVRLILWTMRSAGQEDGDVLQEAVDYCQANGLILFGVNSNPEQHTWTKSPKAYAKLYIDDAAFGCPLIDPGGDRRPYVNWSIVGPAVMKMLGWRVNREERCPFVLGDMNCGIDTDHHEFFGGCDKTIQDCRKKFNNEVRFGGFTRFPK